MKPALLLAAAVAVLAAAPASADNGQRFDVKAQNDAYPSGSAADRKQCFNGRTIAGVNRAGTDRLYVQTDRGALYGLKLADDCGALAQASKISVRADGSYDICAKAGAELVLQTPAGAKRCRVAYVQSVSHSEAAALAAR